MSGADGTCVSICTGLWFLVWSVRPVGRVAAGTCTCPGALHCLAPLGAKQKGRGSRVGFRGPEGACLIEIRLDHPGFEPTEGPHRVLLRLRESGTGCRKGIGMRLCRCFYCRCLGRSLVPLSDREVRGGNGGRGTHGGEAGHTGTQGRDAGHAQVDDGTIGHFHDRAGGLDADHFHRLLSASRGPRTVRWLNSVQHGPRASKKRLFPCLRTYGDSQGLRKLFSGRVSLSSRPPRSHPLDLHRWREHRRRSGETSVRRHRRCGSAPARPRGAARRWPSGSCR